MAAPEGATGLNKNLYIITHDTVLYLIIQYYTIYNILQYYCIFVCILLHIIHYGPFGTNSSVPRHPISGRGDSDSRENVDNRSNRHEQVV